MAIKAPSILSRNDPTKITGQQFNVPIDDARDIALPQTTVGSSTDTTSNASDSNENPNPNRLHNYVNWTYKLALYIVDISKYNEFMSGGTPNLSENAKVIIRTGGIGTAASFAEDVYIQDMRFTSVIGNRLQAAATNNFDLIMTIKEPYGAKLIGDIAATAFELGYQNTALADVVYILEIDFSGYDSDGKPVASILGKDKKYIPLKAISVDMRLEAAGASYNFMFVPYSFYAFSPHYASISRNIRLYKPNVKDALDELIASLNKDEEKSVAEGIKTQKDVYSYEVKSFTPDNSENQDMLNSVFAHSSNGKTGVIPWRTDDNTSYYMTINGGSLIKDAIKNIILSSEYFNKKFNASAGNTTPAEMLKIIPEVKITRNFDAKRNEYAKEIKYKITNTFSYGEVQPGLGTAPVDANKISKIYNYLFTGKNEDITNLDLNWNLLYYTIRTPALNEKAKTYAGSNIAEQRPDVDADVITRLRSKVTEINQMWPNMPYRSLAATVVAEYFDSKMNNSYGDNITIDLEIIGDPDWIPQDSSIRGGAITMGSNNYTNGSIAIDVSGVYVKILLRTPRDYNLDRGLMDINFTKATKETFIEGKYMVITVENIFESGKFKQRLNLVKVPNQTENTPKNIADPITLGSNVG